MADDDLHWEPLNYGRPNGDLVLMLGSTVVARVGRLVSGAGWLSTVGVHRQDWTRRPKVVAPTQVVAQKWAERWTRVNLEREKAFFPVPVRGTAGIIRYVYPDQAASGSPAPKRPQYTDPGGI